MSPNRRASRCQRAAVAVRRTALIAAIGALVPAGAALALGLGEPRTLGALFQPLAVEVPIRDLHGGIDGLDVQAHLMAADGQPLRIPLEVRLVRSADGAVVQIRSTQPIRDPLLQLELRIADGSVRLQRRFDLLLDIAPAPVGPSAPAASRSAAASASPRALAARPEPVADESVTVRPGQSLSTIAQRIAERRGLPIDVVIAALHATNPDAFVGGNIHRLRAGARLRVPDEMRADRSAPDWRRPAAGTPPDARRARPEVERIGVIGAITAPEPAIAVPAAEEPVTRFRFARAVRAIAGPDRVRGRRAAGACRSGTGARAARRARTRPSAIPGSAHAGGCAGARPGHGAGGGNARVRNRH